MNGLMNSRRGVSKTVVTAIALLFIVLVFIIFGLVFKASVENKANKVKDDVSSLETEIVLQNFLKSPAPDDRGTPLDDKTADVGSDITNANLVSWTCTNNKKDKNYIALKNSINTFFDNIYQNDWSLDILYSNSDVDSKNFGHGDVISKVIKSGGNLLKRVVALVTPTSPGGMIAQAFLDSQREKGYGYQVIPCSDGNLAKIRLKTTGWINIKNLKNQAT